jgi:hypothetical protein
LFNLDCFGDDILDDLFAWTFVQVTEEETCKVCMKTFVSGNEFIGECQAGHETTFLEPEDRCKGPGEENTLHGSKCNESFCES